MKFTQNKVNKVKSFLKSNIITTDEKLETNKERYKAEIAKLEQKYNGMLTPKDVVREASNRTSPIHDWFDWNDNGAGEKWRLHQARMLITTIKTISTFNGTQKEYRKYVNVRVDGNEGSGRFYVQTNNALKNPDTKSQVLQRAINEITYWERTYADYKELEDVFNGIKKAKKKLKIKPEFVY